MNWKKNIKNSHLTKGMFQTYKNVQKNYKRYERLKYHGKFIDRSKKFDKLCIVLAGYKEYLYPAVFGRLEVYIEQGIDVCIITSGKWSQEIDALCKKNSWSYLSTKENDVSLVQNVAISLHPHAKYIFKLDEDIFITKAYFSKMLKAYQHAKYGFYNPGVIAPIIPINGYGYVRILYKEDCAQEYIKRFGQIKFSSTPESPIQNNSSVAKFFWGEGNIIPCIDELNEKYGMDELEEKPCSIRFSIGAILFERQLWEDMDFFRVVKGTNSLGVDEADMCNFCCFTSRPLMVSENIVVGHLSFGPQNEAMKQYYSEHQDLFLK